MLYAEAIETGIQRGIAPLDIAELVSSAIEQYRSEPVLGRMLLRDDELIN